MAYYDNNYQYYQPYTYYDPYEPRYDQNYSYNTQYYNNNSYQLSPSEPLIGYYYSTYNNNDNLDDILTSKNNENGEYFYDPVSTQFVISYSNLGNQVSDVGFSEYNPEPYNGGYDIDATYGKALPASDDICYPLSKTMQKLEAKPVTDDGSDDEDEENEDEDYSDDGKEEIVQSTQGEPILTNGNVVGPVTHEKIDSGVDQDEDEDDDYSEGEPRQTKAIVVDLVNQGKIDSEVEDEEDDDSDDGEIEGEPRQTKAIVVDLVNQKNIDSGVEDEDEEDEDYSESEQTNENVVSEVTQKEIELGVEEEEKEKEEENRGDGTEIRRQIPAGYGMEAIDICDGLFGGYFPCLLKRNKISKCNECGGEVKVKRDDYNDNWQGTVDYLFGNPNPYGGSMPEKGSYGDPMYCYHRHQPQQSITGHVQELVQFRDNDYWVDSSRYY